MKITVEESVVRTEMEKVYEAGFDAGRAASDDAKSRCESGSKEVIDKKLIEGFSAKP